MTGSAATSAKERLEGSGHEANDSADPTSADEELVDEPRREAAVELGNDSDEDLAAGSVMVGGCLG
jgi:hypothetical protein